MQCGLGLFPAAIAHLCWHGMFKANLFLSANSVVQERRVATYEKIKLSSFMLAIGCGLIGSLLFASGLQTAWLVGDTRFVLVMLCVITASQFALSILSRITIKSIVLALTMTCLISIVMDSASICSNPCL